jgi:8-oxo-dGTP pyrophosphatase MutT (NUDIX family)
MTDRTTRREVPELVPAATVIILRDAGDGVETLLLRRNSKLAFGGGAWVFPGGRVDDADRVPGEDEQAWARRAAVREAMEEAGVVLEHDELVPFAHWTPPESQVKRFSTWFFLAPATHGEVAIDSGEIVDHFWASPADALGRHAAGDVELLPPTWVTLNFLSAHDNVAATLADAAAQPISTYVTRFSKTADGKTVAMWAGDAGYEAGDPDIEGARHRLHMSGLPWRYERA